MVTNTSGGLAAQPATETAAQRFKRIANNRLGRLEIEIGNIGKMTGSNYAKTPEQITAIETLLNKWVKDAVSNLRLGRGHSTDERSYV